LRKKEAVEGLAVIVEVGIMRDHVFVALIEELSYVG
jgi:hypothetical protein